MQTKKSVVKFKFMQIYELYTATYNHGQDLHSVITVNSFGS